MIATGDKLIDLDMVNRAIGEGFALKIVQESCTYLEGELDDETDELFLWSTTVLEIHYSSSVHSERWMNRYLTSGEVFAALISEYEEFSEYNLKYGDSYYEYK